MEEKERYIYTKIDGYYWIKDTETNKNYCANKTIIKLLNQQDKEIKKWKKIKDNHDKYIEDLKLLIKRMKRKKGENNGKKKTDKRETR